MERSTNGYIYLREVSIDTGSSRRLISVEATEYSLKDVAYYSQWRQVYVKNSIYTGRLEKQEQFETQK